MAWKRTVVWGLVFAASLALVVRDARRAEEAAAARALSARLLGCAADEIVSLDMFASGVRAKLVREGDVWNFVEPFREPADGEAVRALLETLDRADFAGAHVPGRAALADYGLAEPPIRLAIGYERDGKAREQRLAIGGETPVADEVYARLEGEEEAFAIPAAVRDLIRTPIETYRDRRLIAFDPALATNLSITRAGSTIELAKRGESWNLVRPIAGPAEDARVVELLGELRSTRPVDFITTDTFHAEGLGLAAPEIVVSVGEGEEIATLAVGRRRLDTPPTYYANRAGADRIFTVPQALVDRLRVEPNDLRSRRLFALAAKDAVELTHRMGSTTTTLRLSAEGWKIEGAPETPVDQGFVKELLNRVLRLKVAEYVSLQPIPEVSGLARPNVSIEVADGSGRVEGIEVGRPEGTLTYARRVGDPEIFLIDGGEPVAFFFPPDEFHDKSLYGFDPKLVRAIEIRQLDPALGEETVFSLRDRGGYWVLENESTKSGFQVRSVLAERFAAAAAGLKWKRRLDPADPAEAAKIEEFSLNAPPTTIVFRDEAGATLAEIGQGGQDRTRVYIRARPGEFYAMDKPAYAAFVETLVPLLSPQ